MKHIIAAVIALTVAQAHARLEETLEQCENRYGPVLAKDTDTALAAFEKNGVRIMAHFFQGKVDALWFFNKEGHSFSEPEVQALALANFGQGWGRMPDDRNSLHSHSFDKWGSINDQGRVVTLYTAAFNERGKGQDLANTDAGRRLKGF